MSELKAAPINHRNTTKGGPVSKHLLFLVHGMGNHPAGVWSKPVVDRLLSLSGRYSFFQAHPLNGFVDFVPIDYDNIFDDILRNWSKTSAKITEFANSISLPRADSLSWLNSAGSRENDFFWSHCTDVIMYRFYKLVRDNVRIAIVDQMVTVINKALQVDKTTPMCSVMAHSLGTAVAHDCLHALATGKHGAGNPFSPSNFRFQNIFMVANTSNLLKTDSNPYTSQLRPGSLGSSYCHRYYNFHHKYDPVAVAGKFNPSPAWNAKYYRDVEIDHIHQLNVHDWLAHLDNPKVHIPVLSAFVPPGAIKKAEFDNAISTFPSFRPGGMMTDPAQAAQKLDLLKNVLGKGDDLPSIVKGLIQYAVDLDIDKLSAEAA